jgi:hypothetical protein
VVVTCTFCSMHMKLIATRVGHVDNRKRKMCFVGYRRLGKMCSVRMYIVSFFPLHKIKLENNNDAFIHFFIMPPRLLEAKF